MLVVFVVVVVRDQMELLSGIGKETFVYTTYYKGTGILNTFGVFVFLLFNSIIFFEYIIPESQKKETFWKTFNYFLFSFSMIYIIAAITSSLGYIFMVPVFYNVPGNIFPVYFPLGSLFGFLASFLLSPILGKKIYKETSLLVLTILGFVFGVIYYLYAYQIGLYLPNVIVTKSYEKIFLPHHFKFYSEILHGFFMSFGAFLYYFPSLFLMPLFIKRVEIEKERYLWKWFYLFVVFLMFLSLFISIDTLFDIVEKNIIVK